ncbi:MAG: ABC transporter permease [Anaerolineales bacterium]|nr:ABC transporter permease [Anaerolineales bacterium]
MNKTWLIFWRTYWGGIRQGSFLAFTFGLPAFFILFPVVAGMIMLWVIRTVIPPTDYHPIGVVDESGVFSLPAPSTGDDTSLLRAGGGDPVEMIGYGSEAEAKKAFEAGEIQGFYFIPEDFLATGMITLTYTTAPSLEVDAMFSDWVERTVAGQVPVEVRERYAEGAQFAHEAVEGETAFSSRDYLKWGGMYLVIYFLQVAGSFTSNYMYGSIASEAHDRTIELILSSVTARQFLVGKFLGLLAMGMTQLAIWVLPAAVGVGLFLARFGTGYLAFLFPWEYMGIVISTLFGAYVLMQVMAAAGGLLRISGGAGPQIFALLEWAGGLGMIYAMYFLPRNPDTWVAVAGSLFPITAPLVLLIRLVTSEVPTWQIVASQGVLWGSVMLGVLSLGRLLKRNLVSYAPKFKLFGWVREHLPFLRLKKAS